MTDQENKTQNVEALQLHYTSCQHGISGYAGFQVRAISEGIMPDEQRTLERLGMYEPPRNLPSEPSLEEIQKSFPKAFRSIFFETGKLVITRSVYAGQDYTGRWGNYFAHALVFKSPVSDLWPVDLYEWEGWKEQLSADEDNTEASTVLPLITVQPNTGAYAFTELQEFLQEDSSRTDRLADMIRAILLHKVTSRKLVIKEELESVGLFWIACLQKSFSPAHQQTLGCSSYQSDPRSCQSVNVTRQETDFILGETERLYQFYAFDFQENIFSEITRRKDDYAETVAGWMSKTPDVLQEFHEFSKRFDCSVLDDSLFSMLRLFQLYKGNKDALPREELMNTLEFVRLQSKPDALEEVVHIIAASAESLMQSDDPICMKELALFFIRSLDIETREQYIDPICTILLRMFDHSLLQNNLAVYEQTVELRTQVKQKIPIDEEFSNAFLTDEHLAIINNNISSRSDKILSAVMREIVAAVRIVEPSGNEYTNANFADFIKNIVSVTAPHLGGLGWMFESSVHDPVKTSWIFFSVTKLNLCNDSRNSLAELFSEMLSDKEQAYRVSVINNLKHEKSAWPLLYEDWRRCITREKRKKISAHAEYCRLMLNDKSAYSKKANIDLATELWGMLLEKERIEQAICWINEKELINFPSPFIQELFSTASRKIKFDPQDFSSEILAQTFSDYLEQLDIQEVLPRVKLRQAVSNAYAGDNEACTEKKLSELNKIFLQIDEKTYEEFIKLYLPEVLTKAKHPDGHRVILRYIFSMKYCSVFQKVYISFFKKNSRKQLDAPSKAALDFWLFFRSREQDYPLLHPLRECALNGLVFRLSRLEKKSYSYLVCKMDTNPKLTHEAKRLWNKIRADSEIKRNSKISKLLNRVKNIIPGYMR